MLYPIKAYTTTLKTKSVAFKINRNAVSFQHLDIVVVLLACYCHNDGNDWVSYSFCVITILEPYGFVLLRLLLDVKVVTASYFHSHSLPVVSPVVMITSCSNT